MTGLRYPRCKGCGKEIVTTWGNEEKEYCNSCECEKDLIESTSK